jgi:carboxylate-amine ligase
MADEEVTDPAGASFGVEEEFLLVDPDTGRTVPSAAEVLHTAAVLRPAAPDATLRAELFESQVEAATGSCATLDELAARLTHGRHQLTTAARAAGTWLVPSGCAVLGGLVAPHAGFAAVADTYAAIVCDHQACGCHVQVAVADRETAVAVVNHLRPWLPTLLALSVNSPFQDGVDTGYASWRVVQRSRLPSGGMPPHCASARAYDARVARLVEQGVLVDEASTWWLARPSARLSGVDVRVADTGIDVDATLLQAALSRALVMTALADLADGREAPAIGEQVAAAALWSAARHGMAGPGIHPVLERGAPATVLVTELLTDVRPALEETGDLATVEDGVRRLLRLGTGASRQRAAGAPYEVVRMLASGTVPGH